MTLVTLSGIDGSGKTLLTNEVARTLRDRGIAARAIRPDYRCNDVVKAFCTERFGDPYAYVPHLDPTLYISVLLADWLDLARASFGSADGELLVCDRYLVDVAAQAVHYGADLEVVLRTVSLFPVPDVAFFLRIPPSAAHVRLRQRPAPALHHLESEANLEVLARAYERVWPLFGWEPVELDAELPADEVKDAIVRYLEQRPQ